MPRSPSRARYASAVISLGVSLLTGLFLVGSVGDTTRRRTTVNEPIGMFLAGLPVPIDHGRMGNLTAIPPGLYECPINDDRVPEHAQKHTQARRKPHGLGPGR